MTQQERDAFLLSKGPLRRLRFSDAAALEVMPLLTLGDAVADLRLLAVTHLQAIARRFVARLRDKERRAQALFVEHRRRRMAKAMRRWHMWADSTQDYRAITTRRFHVWLFQTRRVLRKRLVFTKCFWPFFIWRRWWAQQRLAKEKARF